MSISGYPDWQDYPTWQGPQLQPAFTTTYPVGVTLGAVQLMTNFGSVLVRFIPTAGQGVVTIRFFLDQAATQQIGSSGYSVNTAGLLSAIVPVRGPWMRVDFSNTGAAPATVQTTVLGLNAFIGLTVHTAGSTRRSWTAQSVAASGTFTQALQFHILGTYSVCLIPGDALGKLHYQLVTVDETGAVGAVLADFGLPTAVVNASGPCPDDLVALTVINTDAGAAHTFSGSLQAIGL